MQGIEIYMKCGKTINDPTCTQEQFDHVVKWMEDEVKTSITVVKNVWIRKEEILLINFIDPELYKNSPPSQ